MIFHKYPKIFSIGRDENKDIFLNPSDLIHVEEKIDGANFRFMVIDNRIVFGSRNNSLGDDNSPIGGNFSRCVRFVSDSLKGKVVPEGIVFFGECCVKHSLEYDWDKIPPYLGFDVLVGDGSFMSYDDKVRLFDSLSLPVVPLVNTFRASELVGVDSNSLIPTTVFGSVPAEGIVFKNYSCNIFAKFVTEKFLEVNKAAFGASKRFSSNDSERIVAGFCTNSRIDKHVFNLVSEGYSLDMSLMRFLPKRVVDDVYVEHWSDIVNSRMVVDFSLVRSLINVRCRTVLKSIITNQSLVV